MKNITAYSLPYSTILGLKKHGIKSITFNIFCVMLQREKGSDTKKLLKLFDNKIKYITLNQSLNRLIKKGYVKTKKVDKKILYVPSITMKKLKERFEYLPGSNFKLHLEFEQMIKYGKNYINVLQYDFFSHTTNTDEGTMIKKSILHYNCLTNTDIKFLHTIGLEKEYNYQKLNAREKYYLEENTLLNRHCCTQIPNTYKFNIRKDKHLTFFKKHELIETIKNLYGMDIEQDSVAENGQSENYLETMIGSYLNCKVQKIQHIGLLEIGKSYYKYSVNNQINHTLGYMHKWYDNFID